MINNGCCWWLSVSHKALFSIFCNSFLLLFSLYTLLIILYMYFVVECISTTTQQQARNSNTFTTLTLQKWKHVGASMKHRFPLVLYYHTATCRREWKWWMFFWKMWWQIYTTLLYIFYCVPINHTVCM